MRQKSDIARFRCACGHTRLVIADGRAVRCVCGMRCKVVSDGLGSWTPVNVGDRERVDALRDAGHMPSIRWWYAPSERRFEE